MRLRTTLDAWTGGFAEFVLSNREGLGMTSLKRNQRFARGRHRLISTRPSAAATLPLIGA